MRTFILVLALAAGCVSSKERIVRGEEDASSSVGVIDRASARGHGALEGIAGLPMVSAVEAAVEARGALADVREGTKGVRNRPSWGRSLLSWARPLLWVLGLVLIVALGGGPLLLGVLGWLRRRGVALSRKVVSEARLMRKAREKASPAARTELDAMVAAKREDPHFEAAWRKVKAEARSG